MELNRLEKFYYVAREGNLTKAANYLNISQPALSRCITLFEHRIGCKLFIRYARGVKLTPEGQKLYEFSERFKKEGDLLGKTFKTNTLEGELVIGVSPYLNSSWFNEHLYDYIALHPELKLKITNLFDNNPSQGADVSIGFKEFIPSATISHTLLKTHMGLFASSAYLKKYGTPQKIEDLNKHHLVSYCNHQDIPYKQKTPWILNVGNGQEPMREPLLKVSALEDLLSAACKNLGIIELPCNIKAIEDHNLVPVLPTLQGPEVELVFAYPEELREGVKVQSLKEYLKHNMV